MFEIIRKRDKERNVIDNESDSKSFHFVFNFDEEEKIKSSFENKLFPTMVELTKARATFMVVSIGTCKLLLLLL